MIEIKAGDRYYRGCGGSKRPEEESVMVDDDQAPLIENALLDFYLVPI